MAVRMARSSRANVVPDRRERAIATAAVIDALSAPLRSMEGGDPRYVLDSSKPGGDGEQEADT